MNGNFLPGTNVFRLYAEQGVPPEITVMLAHDNGVTVEWPSFISEAIRNGWSIRKTYTTIVTAVKEADIFQDKQLEEFTQMARNYFCAMNMVVA